MSYVLDLNVLMILLSSANLDHIYSIHYHNQHIIFYFLHRSWKPTTGTPGMGTGVKYSGYYSPRGIATHRICL